MSSNNERRTTERQRTTTKESEPQATYTRMLCLLCLVAASLCFAVYDARAALVCDARFSHELCSVLRLLMRFPFVTTHF